MPELSNKQNWFSETVTALRLLLKAMFQSLMFTTFGSLLAPLALIGMLIGWFPNAVAAVYSAIIIIPLLIVFFFQAFYCLTLSLLGRSPNYRSGIYGAAHWIDEVSLSNPMVKVRKGKWPLTVKLAPTLSVVILLGVIVALPYQGSANSHLTAEERLQWEGEKVIFCLNYILGNHFSNIEIAIHHGWNNVAKKLMKPGFNEHRAIQHSIDFENKEILEYLIHEKKLSVDEYSMLNKAVYFNRVEIASYLLKIGANVNAYKGDLLPPLHEAAAKGYAEMAQLLITHGANVNSESKYRMTPLHRATDNDNSVEDEEALVRIIQILLENGADVNATNRGKDTPLHLTARVPIKIHYSPPSYLRQETPLPPRLRCAKLLIDSGANLNAKNYKGELPIDLAEDEEMYELLREKMDLNKQ